MVVLEGGRVLMNEEYKSSKDIAVRLLPPARSLTHSLTHLLTRSTRVTRASWRALPSFLTHSLTLSVLRFLSLPVAPSLSFSLPPRGVRCRDEEFKSNEDIVVRLYP